MDGSCRSQSSFRNYQPQFTRNRKGKPQIPADNTDSNLRFIREELMVQHRASPFRILFGERLAKEWDTEEWDKTLERTPDVFCLSALLSLTACNRVCRGFLDSHCIRKLT